MDLWTFAALAMLVVWGVGTFAFAGPGWLHLLLSVAVFVIIWRIVVRGTPPGASPGTPREPTRRDGSR